jgi:hypothetical protein
MLLASLGPSRPPDICSKLELIRPSKTNTAVRLSLEPSSMAKLSYGSLQDRGTSGLANFAQNIRPKDLSVWSLVILRRMDLLAEAILRGVALDI